MFGRAGGRIVKKPVRKPGATTSLTAMGLFQPEFCVRVQAGRIATIDPAPGLHMKKKPQPTPTSTTASTSTSTAKTHPNPSSTSTAAAGILHRYASAGVLRTGKEADAQRRGLVSAMIARKQQLQGSVSVSVTTQAGPSTAFTSTSTTAMKRLSLTESEYAERAAVPDVTMTVMPHPALLAAQMHHLPAPHVVLGVSMAEAAERTQERVGVAEARMEAEEEEEEKKKQAAAKQKEIAARPGTAAAFAAAASLGWGSYAPPMLHGSALRQTAVAGVWPPQRTGTQPGMMVPITGPLSSLQTTTVTWEGVRPARLQAPVSASVVVVPAVAPSTPIRPMAPLVTLPPVAVISPAALAADTGPGSANAALLAMLSSQPLPVPSPPPSLVQPLFPSLPPTVSAVLSMGLAVGTSPPAARPTSAAAGVPVSAFAPTDAGTSFAGLAAATPSQGEQTRPLSAPPPTSFPGLYDPVFTPKP